MITCEPFSITALTLVANDYQLHCRFARRAQEITLVNDSLPVLSISYVKCDKYVTHFILWYMICLSSRGCQYILWYGTLYFMVEIYYGGGYPPISIT